MTEPTTTPSLTASALMTVSEASQSERPRIYVACLAAYNNGRLHGRWIDATTAAADFGRCLTGEDAVGRSNFATLNLAHQRIVQSGRDCLILTWRGTSTNSVLAFALASAGLDVEVIRAGVAVSNATLEAVKRELSSFAAEPPSAELVSGFVQNLQVAKFDNLVPETLLRRLWAERHVETCEAIPWLVEDIIG